MARRPERSLAKFERTMADWYATLERIGEHQFTPAPEGDGWTAGQVCHHVALAGGKFLEQVRACANGEGETKGFQLLPALVTGIGSFPPARIRFPTDKAPPGWRKAGDPDPLTRTEALEQLARMEHAMHEHCAMAAAAGTHMRTKHFAAGWMHAAQWYQLVEMHTRHHLRQLRRL
jgi:hypothetical protein